MFKTIHVSDMILTVELISSSYSDYQQINQHQIQ